MLQRYVVDTLSRTKPQYTALLGSGPTSITLISIWCWLNVAASVPTVGDPAIVLFGFAAFGASALLLKVLILANAVVATALLSMKLHPGRLVVSGFMVFMFLSATFTDVLPSCPAPVKIAAYQQTLFGGLLPYLYVTAVPGAPFLPMHLANLAVTAIILIKLRQHRSLFSRPRTLRAGRR